MLKQYSMYKYNKDVVDIIIVTYYHVNDSKSTVHINHIFQLQNISCFIYYPYISIHLPINIKHASKDVI